jgi:hypothetical protein
MTSVFLSYTRNDDEASVHGLRVDLASAGFNAGFQRVSPPAR